MPHPGPDRFGTQNTTTAHSQRRSGKTASHQLRRNRFISALQVSQRHIRQRCRISARTASAHKTALQRIPAAEAEGYDSATMMSNASAGLGTLAEGCAERCFGGWWACRRLAALGLWRGRGPRGADGLPTGRPRPWEGRAIGVAALSESSCKPTIRRNDTLRPPPARAASRKRPKRARSHSAGQGRVMKTAETCQVPIHRPGPRHENGRNVPGRR